MAAGAFQVSSPLERTRARLVAAIRERNAAEVGTYLREFHQCRVDELLEEYLRLMPDK